MCEAPDLAACIVATVVICAVAFAVGLWLYVHWPQQSEGSKAVQEFRNKERKRLRYEGRDLPR